MFAELSGIRPIVTVVIPARNEERCIGHVLKRLPDRVDEVILVDGHSVDGTVEAARSVRPDIRVVNQIRKGKGNALAAGFAAATGEYIVMIDADGSMDAADILAFVAALDAGADYAKGTRFVAGAGSSDISRLRQLGNQALLGLTNLLFGTDFTDLCYGFVAFRRDLLLAFLLPDALAAGKPRWGDGFEIETLLNTRAAKTGAVISEVSSFESPRLYGQSNLRTFRDGWRVLCTIFRERVTTTPRLADILRVRQLTAVPAGPQAPLVRNGAARGEPARQAVRSAEAAVSSPAGAGTSPRTSEGQAPEQGRQLVLGRSPGIGTDERSSGVPW